MLAVFFALRAARPGSGFQLPFGGIARFLEAGKYLAAEEMERGDIFDSALSLEEALKDEGYKEGFEDGMISGREEAKLLGIQHGFAVGEELGFYGGCVQIWDLAIAIDSLTFTGRVQKSIRQIGEMVENYPMLDPENESSQDALEAIRLKFRAVSASIGVRLEYPKSSGDSRADF